MKGRTVFKWAIGVLAIVVLIGIGTVVWLIVAALMSLEKGEQHRRQLQAEQDSGRWDFGDQPALFAVVQGIVKNDPEAIRTAAKDVPDLQAAGRDGATLLNFAVRQSWQRPESVEAVRTLLSLGADPNYTNGNRNSFAMASAGHSSAAVLRAMLDAGDRDSSYSLIMAVTSILRCQLTLRILPVIRCCFTAQKWGLDDNLAYVDALLLLERGADGMTFGKMLMNHRAHFQKTHKSPPAEFAALWSWAESHGIVQLTEQVRDLNS